MQGLVVILHFTPFAALDNIFETNIRKNKLVNGHQYEEAELKCKIPIL